MKCEGCGAEAETTAVEKDGETKQLCAGCAGKGAGGKCEGCGAETENLKEVEKDGQKKMVCESCSGM